MWPSDLGELEPTRSWDELIHASRGRGRQLRRRRHLKHGAVALVLVAGLAPVWASVSSAAGGDSSISMIPATRGPQPTPGAATPTTTGQPAPVEHGQSGQPPVQPRATPFTINRQGAPPTAAHAPLPTRALSPVVRKLNYTDPRGDGHFSGQAEPATAMAPSDDSMDLTAIRIRLDSSGLRVEADLVAAFRTDAVYYADFTDATTGCYIAVSLGGGAAEGYYLNCPSTGQSDFVFLKGIPDSGSHLAAFVPLSMLPTQVSGHHQLSNVYVESRLDDPAGGSLRYDYANAPKTLDPV